MRLKAESRKQKAVNDDHAAGLPSADCLLPSPRAPGGLPRVAAAGWLLYECDVVGGERHRWRKLGGEATRWCESYEAAMRETLERRQKAESRKQ